MFKSCALDNMTMDKTDRMVSDYINQQKVYLISTENVIKKLSLSLILKEMNFVKCWINQKVFDSNQIVLTSLTEFLYETKELVKFSVFQSETRFG